MLMTVPLSSQYSPQITLVALRLISDSLKAPVVLDLSSHEKRAALKKDGEVNIKEVSSLHLAMRVCTQKVEKC